MAPNTIQSISRPIVVLPLPRKAEKAKQLATRLYRKARQLKGQDKSQPLAKEHGHSPIRLVCISDTHNNKLPPSHLPDGHVLLHAGDLSQYGTFAEIQSQLSWLASQPHEHKIVIAGNHDLLLDSAFVASHPDRELDRHVGKRRADLDWGQGGDTGGAISAVHYVEHNALDVSVCVDAETEDGHRTIRVFGSPWTPRCGSWAFQYDGQGIPNAKASPMNTRHFRWKGAVPDGIDVLLVHGPPLGHLDDGGKGCQQLLAELWRSRPKVVVCGHIHGGHGEEWLFYDQSQKWYEDVVTKQGNPWLAVIGLAVTVCWWTLVGILRRTAGKPPSSTKGVTHLVNAAVVGDRGSKAIRPAITVVI